MSAIPTKPTSPKKSSSAKNYALIFGTLGGIALLILAYLMWYVAPEEVLERVTIIAVNDAGCIGQTADGYAVNIGQCDAEPGESVYVLVDQKVKERADLMNPTGR